MPEAGAPIRVALLAPWAGQCGIADYTRLLVSALQATGEVSIAGVVEPQTARTSGAAALVHRRRDAQEYRKLAAALDALQPDLVHVQYQYFFFGGVGPHKNRATELLSALRSPVAVTAHELAGRAAHGIAGRAVRMTDRRVFLHPAIRALIVHTAQDADYLVSIGAPSGRVHHLVHGIPTARATAPSLQAKQALGLQGRRVVTVFGFLSAKKGHLLALQALEGLPEDVTLLFAGGRHPQDASSYAADLVAAAARANGSTTRAGPSATGAGGAQAERVRITGYLQEDQIPTVMAATDLAIAPFRISSGSGSLANLLAYGRPVLASDIPPHRVLTQEQPAAVALFRSESAESLREGIASLLADPAARHQLAQAALAYSGRHGYAEMAQETIAVYRRVIG